MASVHWDNLDTISDKPVLVRARVRMLTTSEGGRQGAVPKGYRPNHNFGDDTNRLFFIGQVEFRDGEWLQLGETKDVLVRFLNVQGLAEKLNVGARWRIQEGPQLVGIAEVLGAVDET